MRSTFNIHENPHSDRDIVDKFMFNVSDRLDAETAKRLSAAILGLDPGASVRGLSIGAVQDMATTAARGAARA